MSEVAFDPLSVIDDSTPCAFSRFPQTDDELWEFVATVWGVEIPRKKICPQHCAPFDAFADAFFCKAENAIWLASRGLGGKSFLLATLGLTEAVCLGATATVLGGSGAQSQNVHRYMQDMWSYPAAPRQLLAEDPTKMRTVLKNGAYVQALLASSTSVRGPHPVRLRCDECLTGDSLVLMADGSKKRLDRVEPSDKVVTFYRGCLCEGVVLASEYKGVRETLKLRTEAGNEIVCTKEHPVLGESGWREASTFAAGDYIWLSDNSADVLPPGREEVSRLWESFEAQDGSAGDGVLQRVSNGEGQETEVLRRMRDSGWKPIEALSALLLQTKEEVKSFLQGLWNRIAFSFYEALSPLPPQVHVLGTHGFEDVGFQSYGYEKQGGEIESRNTGGGASSTVQDKLSRASSSLPLYSGLRSGRLQGCDRGTRGVLARQARCEEKGSSKKESFGEEGLAGSFLANRKAPPVVARSRVASIQQAGRSGVYDIRVSPGKSFVANGIIVHNCDEMKLDILDAALGQPMSKDGIPAQTVMSSTHHYPDGTVTELLNRAKERGMPVYNWCYRESMAGGWLSPADVEAARARVPLAMWDVEFELQEPSPEGRAIQPQAVEWTFDQSLGYFEGQANEKIVLEPPQEGAKYVTGADWAKESDWTVIITFRIDVTPWKLVMFERLGRRPWPEMVEKFNDRLTRYRGVGVHDATGLGNVVDDFVTNRAARGEVLVGKNRAEIFSEYVAALENREVVAPRIDFMYAEHKYCTVDDLWGSGHPPDSFVAGALAWRGKRFSQSTGTVRSIVSHPKWKERSDERIARRLEPWKFD